eukprot:2278815-Pleurochrysis_carterae.AAC.8
MNSNGKSERGALWRRVLDCVPKLVLDLNNVPLATKRALPTQVLHFRICKLCPSLRKSPASRAF